MTEVTAVMLTAAVVAVISSYLIIIGAELTAEETNDIREESPMNRSLCVRLVRFGDGLERDIDITLEFVSSGMNFDSEGNMIAC